LEADGRRENPLHVPAEMAARSIGCPQVARVDPTRNLPLKTDN
jgi:hypothetical protein